MPDATTFPSFDDLPALLPAEAMEVVVELLASADDPAARDAARRLGAHASLVLSAGPAPGEGGGLFRSLPPFRHETRRRAPPGPATCRRLDAEDVRRWFEPDGPFARALPGYEPRPEQVRMAGDVAEAFSSGRHLVVEAGTGVGKTMAYLVPAVLWSLANDAPVVVSTNTKNLQDQLFRKDLPLVAGLVRSPVRFALVKGRGNYLCLSRLARLLDRREAELSPADLPALARAVAWAFLTVSGDLAEFDPGPPPGGGDAPPFPVERLASNADDCRGRKCPWWSRCFLQKARADALAADIVVTNHAVFFSEPEDRPLALPKAAQVVFDEAHNLEEAATEHFSREAMPRTLRQILRRLRAAGRRARPARRGGAAAAGGSGLLPDLERLLLEERCMATPAAEEALLGLLGEARRLADAADAAGRAWFRALGALPRRGDAQLRLRPETRESPAWLATVPALQAFQDALYALGAALERLSFVFRPREDAPAPEAGGVALVLASSALAAPDGGADDPLSEMRLAARAAEAARRLEAAHAAVQGLLFDIDFLAEGSDAGWAYWVAMAPASPGRRGAAEAGLRAAPVEVAGFLADGLFAKVDSVVLCSATMSVSGSAKFLSARLGLDRIEPERILESRMGSPFDYARQCLAAVPMFLPDQTPGPRGETEDAAFPAALGDLLARIAAIAGGRTMALFTSYRMMEAVAARATPALRAAGIRLLVQGGGLSREAITHRFREADRPSVLLGTDSFWEGVDVVGDALRCLVIAKLPFDSPGDPLVDARCERIESGGGSAFFDYAVPSAVIRFRQGFGRLIRHRNDRGAVIVADTRIFTKGYGAVFRKNLPAELVRYADESRLLSDLSAFLSSSEIAPSPPVPASFAPPAPSFPPLS